MRTLTTLLLAWLFIGPAVGRSLFQRKDPDINISISPASVLDSSSHAPRADTNSPTDLSWVKIWAALGDSFTAGIGAGQLYTMGGADLACSRYDQSWPAVLEQRFGSQRYFNFSACSGDRTDGIYKQAMDLRPAVDLVVMTAGGNDLCLLTKSDIISTCVLYPSRSEESCEELIELAQDHISTILQPNIRDILTELNNKIKKDGILVYTLYAQYFNTENEDCAEKHDWSFPSVAGFEALPLTVERRKRFNKLVLNINNAIKEVADEYNSNPDIGYRITTADWDVWPRQAVVGQFCVPGTGRDYPDENQPDLHFFRPSLGSKEPGGHDDLKRRALMSRGTVNETEAQQYEAEIYNSMFYSSANPAADTIRSLEGRAPFPADCPGDDSWTYGFGLPDRWGKWFHPNELGHRTIASFVLEAIFAERAKILGVTNEACSLKNQLDCYEEKVTGSQYVTADTMDRTYKIYCDEVNLLGDSDERVFYDNTPDGHRYRIFRTDSSSEFSVENCKSAFKKLVHGCWSGSPLNWKLGGSYAEGGFIYIVRPKGNKRPWPMIEKPDGECFAYMGYSEAFYTLRGAGWASWDRGRETLYKAISRCTGTDIENNQWRWEYFDELQDGMEWQVTFTLKQGSFYCFYDEEVQAEVGGFTHGCQAMYAR